MIANGKHGAFESLLKKLPGDWMNFLMVTFNVGHLGRPIRCETIRH